MVTTQITNTNLIERVKLRLFESAGGANPVSPVELFRLDIVVAFPAVFRDAANSVHKLAIDTFRELHAFHQMITIMGFTTIRLGNKEPSTAIANAAHVFNKNIFHSPLVVGGVTASNTLIPKERGKIARRG